MPLTKYLNDAKAITGSDYQTAKRLNLTRAAISRARKTGMMSDENIIELAKLLDADPLPIIATCNLERHPENKKFWSKWAPASAAVSAILALAGLFYLHDFAPYSPDLALPILYIMRNSIFGLERPETGFFRGFWRFSGFFAIRSSQSPTMPGRAFIIEREFNSLRTRNLK